MWAISYFLHPQQCKARVTEDAGCKDCNQRYILIKNSGFLSRGSAWCEKFSRIKRLCLRNFLMVCAGYMPGGGAGFFANFPE